MSCINNSSDVNQTFIIEPLIIDDTFTTGATLINNIIYFDRTDMLSAYTANLNSLASANTYVTGMTYNNNNSLIITRNDGISLTVNLSTFTGLTVNGTISATTFFGDGSQLTGLSGLEKYTNNDSTPTAIGGIAAGSTFSGQTMTNMWDLLLYPYQTPNFTSFARTNLSSEYELGQPVLNGNQTFTWGTSNSSNIIPSTIKIDQLFPSSVILVSGSTNDGTQLINLTGATISTSTSASISMYRITGTNSKSITFTTTISRNWRNRWYYGKNINNSLTSAQITGLTNTGLVSSVTNSNITFNATVTPEYLYVIIPQSLSQPTDWRDSVAGCFGNNIPYLSLGVVNITNIYGITISYTIYRSVNQITGTQNVWLCS
jgi:hypothetical protein